MVGETDHKDKHEARRIAISLVVVLLLAGLALTLALWGLEEFVRVYFEPGLGLRGAAIIAFFVSVILMFVFALVSGDGMLGELQYILAGFFSFFLIFWLMIAWIF